MKLRTPLIAILILGAFLVPGSGSVVANDEDPHVEIVAISGNLDALAVSFISDRINAASSSGASLVIIQLDSRATLSEAVHHLIARISDPPVPVAVWVGPEPATAFGGAAHLLAAAPLRAAAPGVEIGYPNPIVAGSSPADDSGLLGFADRDILVVSQPIPGLVDIVAPSISNLLVELHGRTVQIRDAATTIHTIRETGGQTTAIETRFYEPSLMTRVLRVATGEEAAFFLLMIGLAVMVFEFYALGPGIAAAVAMFCLLLAGYGVSTLPLRGWAVGAAALGIMLLTADFQRGHTGRLALAGAISMLVGGLFFTDAAPQISPSWPAILVIVLSVTAFYLVGMRTVARARFSTPTVGRSHLVGRRGVAVTPFSPEGEAEVDGARWKAAAHREAHLRPGDDVVVRAVDGATLEVEPLCDKATGNGDQDSTMGEPAPS